LKRYVSLEGITDNPTVYYLTDLNGTRFYKYKLKVASFDSDGIYRKEYPVDDLIVCIYGGIAFASESSIQTKIVKGPAWRHLQLWNDTITHQTHVNNFGSDYFSDMKYKDGLTFRIKPILEKRLNNGQIKIDCANLCLSVLIEYGLFYGLPILLKDYRLTTSNRLLNSKNTQYNSITKFDKAAKQTYVAFTLFSDDNLFIQDIDWNSIRLSHIITWKSNIILIIHPNQTYYAHTISELTNNSITVIQGSLENEQPTNIEKKVYERNSDGSVNPGLWKSYFKYGGSGGIQAKRWKFNVFDNA